MNLLSFGEIIWDSYGDSYTIGGAPLNLAAHYAIQGGDAWLASAVGNDVLGTRATEHIKALGLKQITFLFWTDCRPVNVSLRLMKRAYRSIIFLKTSLVQTLTT